MTRIFRANEKCFLIQTRTTQSQSDFETNSNRWGFEKLFLLEPKLCAETRTTKSACHLLFVYA